MRVPLVFAVCAMLAAQDLPFLRPAASHVTVETTVLRSEDPPTSKSRSKDSRISTRASATTKRSKSLQPTTLVVDVTPNPDIHVYAPGADGYDAVSLAIAPTRGVTPGALRYPKPAMLTTDAERVPVFSDRFQLLLPITIDRATAGASPITVSGTLHLQACDDQICYKPETIPVSWEIRP